jgi:hypothetical protein
VAAFARDANEKCGKERFTFLTTSPASEPGPRIARGASASSCRRLSKERAITEMKNDTLFADRPSIWCPRTLSLCEFYRRHSLIFRAREFRATPSSHEKIRWENEVVSRAGFQQCLGSSTCSSSSDQGDTRLISATLFNARSGRGDIKFFRSTYLSSIRVPTMPVSQTRLDRIEPRVAMCAKSPMVSTSWRAIRPITAIPNAWVDASYGHSPGF